jgi:nucleoid-associated protein YgaU
VKYLTVLILFVLLLAGCVGGKGCKSDPPPPTATIPPPTIAPTVTRIPATSTPEAPTIAPVTITPTATATETQPPTVTIVATTATPALLGHHIVEQGDTMWDIGLWWYRGRYFATGAEVWTPICEANEHIENCRMIYIGDILAIPALP